MKRDNKDAKFDVVQTWLDNVAYSHSHSKSTREGYSRNFRRFCDFIGKLPEEILAEYQTLEERTFRQKYSQYLRGWIAHLCSHGYTNNSVSVMSAVIVSFFKYSDLPLGHIPSARRKVVYHNRDITKEDILNIMSVAHPRDRAFYVLMAQSGLRPYTICLLRMKHIQPDFDNGVVPCKIDIPEEIAKGQYRSHFSFIGEDALKHLRDYLKTRSNLTSESLLFTQHGSEKPLDRRTVTHRFRDAVLKLKKKGLVEYSQKAKAKPGTIRLYSLRKFFRKEAGHAGFEYVQFWMGHIVSEGQEEHYRPSDVEHHRQLYREKAMPHLRLEEATPSETDKLIEKQALEIKKLKEEMYELKGLKETLVTIENQLYKDRAILDEDRALFEEMLEKSSARALLEEKKEKAQKKKT